LLGCKHNSTKSPQSVSLGSDPSDPATDLRDNHTAGPYKYEVLPSADVAGYVPEITGLTTPSHGYWTNRTSYLEGFTERSITQGFSSELKMFLKTEQHL